VPVDVDSGVAIALSCGDIVSPGADADPVSLGNSDGDSLGEGEGASEGKGYQVVCNRELGSNFRREDSKILHADPFSSQKRAQASGTLGVSNNITGVIACDSFA